MGLPGPSHGVGRVEDTLTSLGGEMMGLPGPSHEIGRVEDTLTSFGGGMMGSPGPGHGVGRVEDTLTSVRLREGWALAPFPFSWSRSIDVYGQWCPLICLFRYFPGNT